MAADMLTMAQRRFRPDVPAPSVTCRVCFAHVVLEAERIDDTPMCVYYRCPECDCWFPIRRSDADALRETDIHPGPRSIR
ncbi:hypothetical protein BH24ACT3_BH24ACT3_17300 [soil metagenome]